MPSGFGGKLAPAEPISTTLEMRKESILCAESFPKSSADLGNQGRKMYCEVQYTLQRVEGYANKGRRCR